MLSFVNDYSELCHPRVLARLAEDNFEPQSGYGTDAICAEATARIRAAVSCQSSFHGPESSQTSSFRSSKRRLSPSAA